MSLGKVATDVFIVLELIGHMLIFDNLSIKQKDAIQRLKAWAKIQSGDS